MGTAPSGRAPDRLATSSRRSRGRFAYLLDYDGVWLPLRDPEFFRKVAIHPGGITIYWPGEVDICPDTLYLETQEAAGVAA